MINKYSAKATLDYSIRCYMGPNVSQEIKNRIYALPLEHLSAFFFLVTYGEKTEYALENCGKWYDFVNDSIVPVSYNDLYKLKRIGEKGYNAGIKLKELLTQELN